jgi:deoxyribonuclease-1
MSSFKTNLITRMQEWLAAGLMVVAIAGGWYLAGEDLVLELNRNIRTNTTNNFSTAKNHLFNDVDKQLDSTVICVYSGTSVRLVKVNGILKPDPNAGVDVEHTWPCKAVWVNESYYFNRDNSIQGADLHHLYPTRKGVNRSRGNQPFGELPSTARELRVNPDGTLNNSGGGIASGSFRDRNNDDLVIFEPRDDHKGNVARAIFYMSVRYLMPIPEYMENDLRDWNILDPVDEAEKERNSRVENIQGNRNPFIDDSLIVNLIDDF